MDGDCMIIICFVFVVKLSCYDFGVCGCISFFCVIFVISLLLVVNILLCVNLWVFEVDGLFKVYNN